MPVLRHAEIGTARPRRHASRDDGRADLQASAVRQVMLAENWKTSRMVAHYSAGATAERGAVARYL